MSPGNAVRADGASAASTTEASSRGRAAAWLVEWLGLTPEIWANDDAVPLARALRSALDQVAVKTSARAARP